MTMVCNSLGSMAAQNFEANSNAGSIPTIAEGRLPPAVGISISINHFMVSESLADLIAILTFP